jgi:hypothetical protein
MLIVVTFSRAREAWIRQIEEGNPKLLATWLQSSCIKVGPRLHPGCAQVARLHRRDLAPGKPHEWCSVARHHPPGVRADQHCYLWQRTLCQLPR